MKARDEEEVRANMLRRHCGDRSGPLSCSASCSNVLSLSRSRALVSFLLLGMRLWLDPCVARWLEVLDPFLTIFYNRVVIYSDN